MFRKRTISLLAALLCAASLCVGASALEVDCDSVYCFNPEDFSSEELEGICITALPDAASGTVMLGQRVLHPGDILSSEQISQMTFSPLRTESDRDAVVTFLPIYENRVAPASAMTISIRGKQDKAPIAEDSVLETYKNLPNEGLLKVTEPEGKALTFTVTRQPKRGEVQLREDGSFLYTPKKNKVGVDSFTFTAADPAGNVSREATVTVRILKPADSVQYTDTLGSSCRFEAEWMKNTGLFIGEQVGGEYCFHADKPVSKGEFITMTLKTLGIPVDEDAEFTGYTDEVPGWLRPYLAAAMRSGLTKGLPVSDTGALGFEKPITGAEAAVILQNALDLSVSTGAEESEDSLPDWAAAAVTAMNQNGIAVSADGTLNRGQVATMLYGASRLAPDAPGLKLYQ